jgi:two-component system response regulator YesN
VRKSFVMALETLDCEVDVAASGDDGLERARERRYDLVYLDLNMPGKDGVDTLRDLWKANQGVHFYIVTAFHDEFSDRLREAQDDGICFQLLRKPIGIDQIVRFTKIVLGCLEKENRNN